MARVLWARASAVKRPRVRMRQLPERPAMVTRVPGAEESVWVAAEGALAPASEAMGPRKLPSTPPVRMRVHAALAPASEACRGPPQSPSTPPVRVRCVLQAPCLTRGFAATGASKTWFGEFLALAISGHYSQATQAWTFRLELRSSSAVPLFLTPQVRLFPHTRALSHSLPPSVPSSFAPSLSLPSSLPPSFLCFCPPCVLGYCESNSVGIPHIPRSVRGGRASFAPLLTRTPSVHRSD
jgi:hypothetical protein